MVSPSCSKSRTVENKKWHEMGLRIESGKVGPKSARLPIISRDLATSHHPTNLGNHGDNRPCHINRALGADVPYLNWYSSRL